MKEEEAIFFSGISHINLVLLQIDAPYDILSYSFPSIARANRRDTTAVAFIRCSEMGTKGMPTRVQSGDQGNGSNVHPPHVTGSLAHAQHGWWFPEKDQPEYGFKESNVNLFTGGMLYDPHTGSESWRSFLCKVYRA